MARKIPPQKPGGPTGIKRTEAKSGQIYYFEGGKRIPAARGAKQYVRQNFDTIDPDRLTKQEQRSYRARLTAESNKEQIQERASQNFRFGGRFIPKYLRSIMEALELISDKSNRELKKEFPAVTNYGDLIKKINEFPLTVEVPYTAIGLPNERRNRIDFESVIDIVERLDKGADVFCDLNLVVITAPIVDDEFNQVQAGGEVITDRIEALTKIREWEENKASAEKAFDPSAAFIKFFHFGQMDAEAGTLTIDLRESQFEVQSSP
jgi:hypothetical protein